MPNWYPAIFQKIAQQHTVEKVRKFEAVIDKQQAYIRAGSDKPKGLQVTIRDEFRDHVLKGEGFLIVPSGTGLLIPLKSLRDMIGNELVANHTVDVFFKVGQGQMECKGEYHDVSAFLLT